MTEAECLSFSDSIKAHNADLIERFRAGTPASELIRERSDFMDETLSRIWQRFLGGSSDDFALIAVGGYGRQELHPHSDIDILVLRTAGTEFSEETEGNDTFGMELDERLSSFLSFLWDIGLKPAQSVRSIAECVQQAAADQTIMTNLLESRLIIGSETLYERLWSCLGPQHLWPSADFFEAKVAEQTARYAKYHDTAYNLEPNIKEGPGGLRDIQNISWIIKRHHNSRSLNLVREGWLTELECAELIKARDFLWEIRFALHAMTGRCEDRLLFEYQKDLARQFGVQDQNMNQAIEQFMQLYYRTVMGLERLNEVLIQLFKEVGLQHSDKADTRAITAEFRSVNDYLEVQHPAVFRDQPLALFRIFLLLQSNPTIKGIRASTIRLIRQHLYLIDDQFRANPEACRLFMAILRQKNGVTQQLRRMNRYGVLAAYLPAFGHVVGRMQYDLFHVYTVDEHTLFVVRNLRRFSLEIHRSEHPLGNEIFELIEKPEVLYVAALMHDIAKGRGGDHSTLGADMAADFCRRHGMSERDTQLVCWLVQNHLLMSMTAQRKDINDTDVIHEFATAVGDQTALDHLYLLTVADIRATNPNLWNSWKDALLRELYLTTRWVFRRGLNRPVHLTDKIAAVKKESRSLLRALGVADITVERVWDSILNDEYFLRYQPEEVAWHTTALGSCENADLPLVVLRPVSQRGSAEIFVYARNQDFIFAHSTAVLDQLNLTILDARIITIAGDGYILNSYQILEQNGEPIRDHLRQVQICMRLRESLSGAPAAAIKVQRRESRQIKHFTVPTQIYFHDDPQQRHTILELIATDRPGLLSTVGRAFSESGISLYNAKISTIGSRAEDIFYITGPDHQPITDDAQKKALKATIISRVGAS
jgi:[protein-PII] uridylyltransferase